MKKVLILGLLCTSLTTASMANASDEPVPGQKIPSTQLAEWGDLPTYRIDRSVFRVLPVRAGYPGLTLLVNGQGVVGASRNEVTIGKVDAGTVRSTLQQFVPQPLSITYFEQAGVTVARYADFKQAHDAFQALREAMPDAQIRLPVNFGQVPY